MAYTRPPGKGMRKNRATQRRNRYFLTLIGCVVVLILGLALRSFYKGYLDSIIYGDPLVAKYRHLPNEVEQLANIGENQEYEDSQSEKDTFVLDPVQLAPDENEAEVKEAIKDSQPARVEELKSNEKKTRPSLEELKLLSLNAPVRASVRGNLQDASIVTTDPAIVSADHESTLSKEEYNRHWLTQRWQAASNMGGKPIQGLHWLIMDLGETAEQNTIYRQILDFEDAYSVDYSIYYNIYNDLHEDNWILCVDTKPEANRNSMTKGKNKEKFQNAYRYVKNSFRVDLAIDKRKHHVVHTIDHRVGSEVYRLPTDVRYLKLVIHAPGTKYGTSIWRWQVLGTSE
jgi:hypothetical protein